jgi:hypothetical protein
MYISILAEYLSKHTTQTNTDKTTIPQTSTYTDTFPPTSAFGYYLGSRTINATARTLPTTHRLFR